MQYTGSNSCMTRFMFCLLFLKTFLLARENNAFFSFQDYLGILIFIHRWCLVEEEMKFDAGEEREGGRVRKKQVAFTRAL